MVVDLGLTVGALVGVLLSGGFVYAEIGRYATPQVPETLFDLTARSLCLYRRAVRGDPARDRVFPFFLDGERGDPGGRDLPRRTRGGDGGRPVGAPSLALLGSRSERPVLRAQLPCGYLWGIFALAIIAQYLAITTPTVDGILLVLIQSAAILALEVAGALLSLPPSTVAGRTGGGPVPGAIFRAVGFFILGVGALSGISMLADEEVAYAAALVALLGGIFVYRLYRPCPPRSHDRAVGRGLPLVDPARGRLGPIVCTD